MTDVCPIHNQPWREIPAGVSKKTNRPYNAFKVCAVEGCKERPKVEETATSPQKAPQNAVLSDITARLNGIEANQQRIIKGLAMVLGEVQGRFTDKELDGIAEEVK